MAWLKYTPSLPSQISYDSLKFLAGITSILNFWEPRMKNRAEQKGSSLNDSGINKQEHANLLILSAAGITDYYFS